MITLICADALPWLAENKAVGSIITSLPDAEEIGMQLPQWRDWFTNAAASCMLSASPECPVIFYQTDRKAGAWSIASRSYFFPPRIAQGFASSGTK